MKHKLTHGQRKDFHKHSSGNHYLFTVVAILLISMAGIFVFEGGITGYFVSNGLIEYNQTLDITVDSNHDYTWQLEQYPEEFNLKTLELSGRYLGNGTVKVYLETDQGKYLVLNSDTLKPENLMSVTGYVVAAGGDSSSGSGSDSGGGSSSSGDSGGSSGSDSSSGSASSDGGSSDSGSSGSAGKGDSSSSDSSSDNDNSKESKSDSNSDDSKETSDESSNDESDSTEDSSSETDTTSGEDSSTDETAGDETSEETVDETTSEDSSGDTTEEPIDLDEDLTDDSSGETSEGTVDETTSEDNSGDTTEEPAGSDEDLTDDSSSETSEGTVDETTSEDGSEDTTEEPAGSDEDLTDDSSSETSEETEIDEDSSSDAEEVIEEPSETEEIVELPEVENNGSIVEVIEPIIEENITEEIVLDNVTSEVTVNETIVEGVIPENVTFIDENLTELNETVELIENLTLNETIEESLWQRFDFNEVCADSCLLPEGLNSTEYALVFEVEGEIIFNVDSATYLVQNLTTIEQSVDVALNITDSYGELVDAYVTIYDDHSTIESGHSGDIVKFASGYYDVVINPKVMSFSGDTHPVKSITFAGTDLTETTTELAGFEYVETVTSPDFVQQYAIDPRVQFASAKAIITANSSELYRCDSWNFLEQICLDGWTKVRSIVPGEDYEVELLGTQSFAEGYNVTNVSYLKIKEDIRYDAIIDSIVKDDETNDLTVKFHHDSSKPLPIFIKGNVEYLLDKKTSSADENITLTVFNWNDERFRILVGAHTEAFEFGTAKNVDFTTVVRDASGSEIDATIELIDSLTDEVKASKNHGQAKKILKEGEYNIKTKLNNHPVQEIEYRDLTIYEDFTADIKIDDVPEFDNYVEVYAIDPTNLNFTNATVTVTATGTELYKCKDWNFATQTCFGTWSLFKSDLIPGQDYTFILTPDDPGFAETVSTCAAEDEAIKGSFGGTCDQTDGSSLETNGGTTETHTYTKGTYAGVRIQSVDTGITNCQSVDEVFFCYEWWSTQVQSAPTDCDISIDANAGASYTAVTTTCPGTTTDPGIICTNVTSLETWTCANFFGASGTRAYAKSELSRPTAGKGSTETATWDVFYFNVTYTESDTSPPASVTNLQNESQDIASIYWTWTNPVDADFNETIIYINGTNVINTTNAFYNATGLDDNTNYTITVHTKDHAGNINNTDVNNTASTTSCGIWINTLDDSPDPVTQGENITFTVNVTSLGTVDTVLLNFDGVNYTMNPDSQDIWTYIYDTTSLSATTYNYYINANCSLGFNAYEKNGTFTVQLGQASVNITDILITPDDDELTAGFQINPVEDNNVTVTLVANITNTTAIDSCEVRIYNASDSYISPTLNIATGIIQTTGTQTQCNTSWNMDYFRNPGDWSVTLDVNLTDSNSDQENSSYYYNTLIAHELSISTVSFSGLPLETVNSSDAYPMYIRNTGNSLVNISLSGSDFIGQTNSSYSIGVGNATYNETATGTYTELATTYQEIYKLSVQQTKEIYFRGYIPSGTISQNYQSTINIRSD